MPSDSDILFDGPDVFARDQEGSQHYLHGPGIANTFQIVEGVCILPVAEAPPDTVDEMAQWSPVAVIRLHSPFRVRKSAFAATKQTRPPVLPAPGSEGKFEFIGGHVDITNVSNGPSFNWKCRTSYTYVENCISRTMDGFVLGMAPFLYPTQEQGAMTGTPPTPSNGSTGSNPSIGAISEAGDDAKRGWWDSQYGPNNYTGMSYFPGLFFNAELNNGGIGAVPQQFNAV